MEMTTQKQDAGKFGRGAKGDVLSSARRVWWVLKEGEKFDGPHFTELAADVACVLAREAGHGLVYVEQSA